MKLLFKLVPAWQLHARAASDRGIEETSPRLDLHRRRPATANRNFPLLPQPFTRASRLPQPFFPGFLQVMDALTVKLRPLGRYFQANQAP
jgi:hypothetical protein